MLNFSHGGELINSPKSLFVTASNAKAATSPANMNIFTEYIKELNFTCDNKYDFREKTYLRSTCYAPLHSYFDSMKDWLVNSKSTQVERGDLVAKFPDCDSVCSKFWSRQPNYDDFMSLNLTRLGQFCTGTDCRLGRFFDS